jgi:hypothetical protein
MSYFINYSENTGISIDTSRAPDATATDIGDIASALTNYSRESLTCSLDDETTALLSDGSYWSGFDVSTGTLEAIYELVTNHNKELAES